MTTDFEKPNTISQATSDKEPTSKESSDQPQDAYNEETGEINWDCPCIANMVQPPCGDTFKEAFSCFVYSKAEPKGADCIEQFRKMQECFQQHPEIYGDQLGEDDDDDEQESKDADKPSQEQSSTTKA